MTAPKEGAFKLRYILSIVAIILLGLAYWFFTELFDGKEEIARLQEIPETEPAVVTELTSLSPIILQDKVPTILNEVSDQAQKLPTLGSPEFALAPKRPEWADLFASASKDEILTPENEALETLETSVVSETLDENVAALQPKIAPTEEISPTVEALINPEASTTPEPQDEDAIADLIPTKDGTLGAEGILLFAGEPDIIPPRRDQLRISTDPLRLILPKMRSAEFEEAHKTELNTEIAPTDLANLDTNILPTDTLADLAVDVPEVETTTLDLLTLADPALKALTPKLRPVSIAQKAKDAQNSLLARADPLLVDIKPRIRPRGLSVPEKVDPSEIEIAVQEAVRDIARPRARPRNIAKIAAKSKTTTEAAVKSEEIQTAALTPEKAKGTSKPSATTPTGVQKEATERSGFSKRRISLIGVYGTASARRALVRLPSGRYVKVTSGQKVSGWKVSAIGESSVRISKGSRNQVLRMPK